MNYIFYSLKLIRNQLSLKQLKIGKVLHQRTKKIFDLHINFITKAED